MFSSSLRVAIALLYSNKARNRREGTLSFMNIMNFSPQLLKASVRLGPSAERLGGQHKALSVAMCSSVGALIC